MPIVPTCPGVAPFQQMMAGQLPDAEVEALLLHLESCDICTRQVAALAEQDMLVDLIRRPSQGVDDPSVERLLQRLRSLVPANPPSGDVQPQKRTFSCSSCGKPLAAKEDLAGKNVRCPHCQQVVLVPTAPPTPSPAIAANPAPASLRPVPSEAPTLTNSAEQHTVASQEPSSNSEWTEFLAPAQAPDELGRLGTYRVLKVLGAGGMGVVFWAEDPHLSRSIALKAMLPAIAAATTARQRFLREAKAAAAVKHDHIVAIYQVGEDRGVPFLAMEFLEGEPLNARLEREPVLPLAETLRIGREIAEGLQAAHEHGLIHRDIKPANIWLEGQRGRVKILDFGLARATNEGGQLTQSGAIVGTPAYMAPEQAQGKSIDGRCDLFSLGCILYRMTTGNPPFRGDDTLSVLCSVAMEELPAPHTVNPEVPVELSDLIVQLLAKSPDARPATAQEVAEQLARLAQRQQGNPVEHPSRSRSRGGPSSSLVAMIAVAAALLIAGAGYGLYQVIIVRDKDGNEVARVKVPKDGKIEVIPEGKGDGGKRPEETRPAVPEVGNDRKAAEWVLSVGGKVQVRVGKSGQDIAAGGKLPPGDLVLLSVDLGARPIADADLAHLAGLTNLTSLILHGTKVGEAGLKHLAGLTNLTELNLGDGWGTVTDDGLKHLAGLTNLTTLHLYRNAVSDAGMKHLAGLSKLTYLNLYDTKVGDAGLEHLAGLTNLTELWLVNTPISDAGVKHLARLNKLIYLNLSGTKLSDAGLEHLAGLTNLSGLELNVTQVTDAGLKHLAGLTKLTSLRLENTRITDAGLEHLTGLPNLTSLWLGSTVVSDAGVKHLLRLPPKPGYLKMNNTRISAAGIGTLKAAFPGVNIEWWERNRAAAEKVLGLGGTVVVLPEGKDAQTVKVVEDLPQKYFRLRGVSLARFTKDPEEVLSLLEKLTDPKFERFSALTLGSFPMSPALLDRLGRLPPLVELSLAGSGVADSMLAGLVRFRKLRRLVLDRNPLRAADLALLTGLAELAELSLADCPMLTQLPEVLAADSPLERLSLAGSPLTDETLKKLSDLQNLRTLDLRDTKASAEGIAALKKALPKCEILSGTRPK